jgi:hypothetical protein
MAITNIYDIEICVDKRTLKVIPYKLEVSVDGDFSGIYTKEGQGPILRVHMTKKNQEVVDYILEVDHSLREYWDEFSEWDTTERFYRDGNAEKMPEVVKDWLASLPVYPIEMSKA